MASASEQSTVPWLAAFRQGMQELRWVEGRDYVLEARYANGDLNAVVSVAAEIAALQPEIVLTQAEFGLAALVQAVKTLPIVLAAAVDPVGTKFVASLKRPGGNITGLANLNSELVFKRLELLKEAFPRISHVGSLSDTPYMARIAQEAAARSKLRSSDIRIAGPADIEPAFKRAAASGVNAFNVTTGPVLGSNHRAIVEAIARARAPAIYGQVLFTESGGLMSYAASIADNYRRAAAYVDKILKGAKPGELPIEQPTKFELAVNLTAAKAAGWVIRPSILARADRVVE